MFHWTQRLANKKSGCLCVLRDFKSLRVFHLDAGIMKSLFWKYFLSLLLLIPRSSLAFYFSVGILFILTLMWFKVDINWRKKSLNKIHIPFIYAPKISRLQLNEMFLVGPKWFLFFFSPAAFLLTFMYQLQGFSALQHHANPFYSSSFTWARRCPRECTAPFATLTGCWWALPQGAPSPFLGLLGPSGSSCRVLLGPDVVWWGWTGGERGRIGPIFSTTKQKQSCC